MFINLHVLTWDSLTTWQIIIQLRHSTAIREKKEREKKSKVYWLFPLIISCYQFMTEVQGEKDNIGVRKMEMTDRTKRKK